MADRFLSGMSLSTCNGDGDSRLSTQIGDIPEELLILVFEKLSATELSIAGQVCSSWNCLTNDDALWKSLFRNYEATHGHEKDATICKEWKRHFKHLHQRMRSDDADRYATRSSRKIFRRSPAGMMLNHVIPCVIMLCAFIIGPLIKPFLGTFLWWTHSPWVLVVSMLIYISSTIAIVMRRVHMLHIPMKAIPMAHTVALCLQTCLHSFAFTMVLSTACQHAWHVFWYDGDESWYSSLYCNYDGRDRGLSEISMLQILAKMMDLVTLSMFRLSIGHLGASMTPWAYGIAELASAWIGANMPYQWINVFYDSSIFAMMGYYTLCRLKLKVIPTWRSLITTFQVLALCGKTFFCFIWGLTVMFGSACCGSGWVWAAQLFHRIAIILLFASFFVRTLRHARR